MEIKKCITCYRTKQYKNKSNKDFICQSCRAKNVREKDMDAARLRERESKRRASEELKEIKKPISIRLQEEVNQFVKKINKQKGFATTQQIFIEMITLYNDIPKTNNEVKMLDTLSVGQQLKYMWNKLEGRIDI